MAPAIDLRGEVTWRLSGERRIGGARTLTSPSVAGGTRSQPAARIAGMIKPSRRRGCSSIAGRGERGHRCIIDGYPPALACIELPGDVAHLRMVAAALRVGNQLPLEIAGVQPCEAWSEAPVALAAQPVAGEAGIGRTGTRAAQRYQLAGRAEAVGRFRRHRRACRQRCNEAGREEANDTSHVSRGTGPLLRRFRFTGHSRRAGDRLPPAFRILLPLALITGGCKPPPEERTAMPLASAERGKAAIERVGCGSCHTSPGVGWPEGKSAPALEGMDRRGLIAGRLPNRPDVLAAFVRNAPALVPETTMPAMPLTEREAIDVAAYLYEIGR